MIVIPAIDLKDGKCVRLRQGRMEDSTVFGDDPLAMATQWVEAGCRRLHLVDLNGAFAGEPVNRGSVEAIAKRYPKLPIQIGGGIRSAETIEQYLAAGVDYVILGTVAVKDPDFTRAMCKEFAGHVIIGMDARNGQVATEGWAEGSDVSALDLAQQFQEAGVVEIVYTDIDRDGMMQGVNVAATRALAAAIDIPVIASGGVTTMDDIKAVYAAASDGLSGVITGRAIYEGSLDFSSAQQWCDAQATDSTGA